MDPAIAARALHVLGIVLWIGGDPEGTFRRIERMHWVLLTISLVTVAGAVAGAHGWVF